MKENMSTVEYANLWHNPNISWYGPATYSTSAASVKHAGYLIYKRDDVWDIVANDACVAHAPNLELAKEMADKRAAAPQRKWVMAKSDLAHLMSVAIGAVYSWVEDGAAALKIPVRALADEETFEMTLSPVHTGLKPFLEKETMWVIDEYDLLTLTRRYAREAYETADDIPRDYSTGSAKCFRFWALDDANPVATRKADLSFS
jgi:hypothetical protein